MLRTFEIMGTDLKPEAQAELCKILGVSDISETNYDIFPIATVDIEDDEDEVE